MEPHTRRKVAEMVLEILTASNIEEATEFNIRVAASERLGIDLSDSASQEFVASIVDTYLLSLNAENVKRKSLKQLEEKPLQESKEQEDKLLQDSGEVLKLKKEDSKRVICQLSNKRKVMVENFRGTTLVSIKEFYDKDGKELPGPKGISLPIDQWSAFKKSVPAIEEAITKMEQRTRSEPPGKQSGNMSNSANVDMLHGKQSGDASNSAIVDYASLEPVPIEIIRFDGKNYQFWVQQMELLLKQLRIGYVLTEVCPNATLEGHVGTKEIAAAKAAEKRWVNDDLMCRRNILSHLSDQLFNWYANRKMSAKELWEELKQVYLYEEFGTKRYQVKKYIEFQMVDEKAIVEQVQELNSIAASISAAGMHIDQNFHGSVIISKLPPSWKDFCAKLMLEEFLPLGKIMERIQIEEASCIGAKRVGEHSNSTVFHQANKGGQRWFDNRPPGTYRNKSETNDRNVACCICGKKGHLSKNCWRRYDN